MLLKRKIFKMLFFLSSFLLWLSAMTCFFFQTNNSTVLALHLVKETGYPKGCVKALGRPLMRLAGRWRTHSLSKEYQVTLSNFHGLQLTDQISHWYSDPTLTIPFPNWQIHHFNFEVYVHYLTFRNCLKRELCQFDQFEMGNISTLAKIIQTWYS